MVLYRGGIVSNIPDPVPSIRLKAMRDGVQEYEYMRLLSDPDGDDKRVDEIVIEIIHRPFGKQSIGNLNVWDNDAEHWDQTRIRMGKLIDEMSR